MIQSRAKNITFPERKTSSQCPIYNHSLLIKTLFDLFNLSSFFRFGLKHHFVGMHAMSSLTSPTSFLNPISAWPALGPPRPPLTAFIMVDIDMYSHEYCSNGGSDSKESICNAGDLGSIPGSGRSPGEGNSYPLQYSCLGNPMDRGGWWATVHGVPKSQIRLSTEHMI